MTPSNSNSLRAKVLATDPNAAAAAALGADVTLFGAFLDAGRTYGPDRPILEDMERQPLSYRRMTLAGLVLGHKLSQMTHRSETVAVLLPNVTGLVVTILGLNAFGRVAALLNFTAGPRNLRSALQTAVVRTVITSRRFVASAKLDDVVAAIAETDVGGGTKPQIVYLEDVRRSISTADKARGFLQALAPAMIHSRHALRPDQPAVILFTSGTEGAPKGVVLSNRNLVANARQIFAHANGHFGPTDIVLNPLPMFHSFGLTAATLMPLLNGMRTVLYPSPLHFKQIAKLIGNAKATVVFATDTFLQGYARAADAGDLKTVRFVVAGAERVKDQTRELWRGSGAVVLEGYGATECSPVLAVNVPETNTFGSVGRLLPHIQARLEPVEGITKGGRLLVRGPNVMAGYLMPEHPGVLVPPTDHWYDTGDIVTLSADGFVAICGRARRFAKIAGEMVSLAAVETVASSLWPDANHVVVAEADAKKGEQLVLVTSRPDASREALLARLRSEGMSDLWAPKSVIVVAEIPVLGSGKIDVPATQELVRSRRKAA